MQTEKFQPIVVGKFAGVYGIKGWLKLISHTEPLENILTYKPWYVLQGAEWCSVNFLQAKRHGKGLIVQLPSIENPEQARSWVNREIAIARAQLPPLAANEYYWNDLIGMQVVDTAGHELGKVLELFATGANDVLVIQGEQRHLIPYLLGKTIVTIEAEPRIITVDWSADFF